MKRKEKLKTKGENNCRRIILKICSMIFLTHLNYFSVNKVPARVGIKKVILEEVEGREVSRFF